MPTSPSTVRAAMAEGAVEGRRDDLTTMRLLGLLRATVRADRTQTGSRGWGRAGALRKPVFLLGAPRSGTTFLGDSLGAVPSVSYHHEPVATKAVTGSFVEEDWSAARARRAFRLTYAVLLAAGHGAGRRFCEKTPQNCFIVPQLAAWFPDATFVHIVRDGRDAALSYAAKPWLAAASAGSGRREPGGYLWGPYARFWVEHDRRREFETTSDLHRCIWAWRRHTEAALAGAAALAPGRLLEVRYEELVADPAREGRRLGEHLGFSSQDTGHLTQALSAAQPGSVGRWRSELDPAGASEVDREAGDLLRRLGYA